MDQLLVADSFRARVGPSTGATEVRGLGLHLDRFRTGAAEMLGGAVERGWWERVFEPFMETVPERIARGGEGFPRVELWRDGATGAPRLDVRLRPLPALGQSLELRSAASAALVSPRVKGPNIARLAELNRELGAEALLLDDAGRAVEGATTAILWWRGDALCRVASPERVASVAEALVLRAAPAPGITPGAAVTAGNTTSAAASFGDSARIGAFRPDRSETTEISERIYAPEGTGAPETTGVSEESRTPAELARHEVWAVNALHGIRPVTAIDGVVLPEPDPDRLRAFRAALDRAWRPVV